MECYFDSVFISNVFAALTTYAWLKTYDPVPLWAVFAVFMTAPFISTYLTGIESPSSSPCLLVAYSVYSMTVMMSVCAYRLSPFHPLASYPGPVILKLTKLWGTWVAYQGKTHVYMKELHDAYGPIVRTGPNELSTIERTLLPQVLGKQGMPKGHLWDGRRLGTAPDKEYETIIDLRNSVLHDELRFPWNKAFAAEPIRNYEVLLIRRVVELKEHLRKSCSGGTALVNITKWFSHFSFDFMGDLAFVGQFNLMKEGDVQRDIVLMHRAMYFLSISQHVPWLAPLLRSLPIFSRGLKEFIDHSIEKAIKRSETDMKRKDLFYYMGEASGSSDLNSDITVGNAILAIVAGSDSTTSVLTNAVYLLLSHPKKHKALQEEVDGVFADHGIILDSRLLAGDEPVARTYGEIFGSLKFLNAVINETLRLFPAVPTGLQRAPAKGTGFRLLQSSEMTIWLPEGNAISVPPYALHRDPRYFSPNPDAFIPERWLTSTTTEYITSRDAFIPFSMGPQNCAGRSLALVELRYVLAALVRNFDMDFDPANFDPSRWEQELEDRFTLKTGDLNIKMTPRVDNMNDL